MRSFLSRRPKFSGRILLISLVSLGLFMGVSGFSPLPKENRPETSQTINDLVPADFVTFLSHNLVVDTQEFRCLALNIYFEARSEPLEGQLAVAGVTMNRVGDKRFPDSICAVVKQGNEARLHRCQFSWWCDGKDDIPNEAMAWHNAQQVARLFLSGVYQDPTEDALWYHADYVSPDWATRMSETRTIGRHIFYKDQEIRTADANS